MYMYPSNVLVSSEPFFSPLTLATKTTLPSYPITKTLNSKSGHLLYRPNSSKLDRRSTSKPFEESYSINYNREGLHLLETASRRRRRESGLQLLD